ncbi:putative Ig domain-containing protein [Planomonospora corallina]|uniref:Ig domain-containing protein n=1 Tax=Planomonospora corallina TaxID=1806052 RepID=A0ABV8I2T5_9ACTN
MPAGRARSRAAGARNTPAAPAAGGSPAPVCRTATRRTVADRLAARRAAVRGDAGFTLVEMLAALVVIGIVMSALTVFFTNSLDFTGRQRTRQVAIQLAADGVDRVRALTGSTVLSGRSKLATTAQQDSAPDAVDPYLRTMKPDWDPMLPESSTAGVSAPLPTSPDTTTVNGLDYARSWYVGRCRQQAGDTTGVSCEHPDSPDPAPGKADVPFFRVVVAVSWQQKGCPAEGCTYVTSTLTSASADAIFNIKRPPPAAADPEARHDYLGDPVDLQLTATGGRLPLTWSATGLPDGLSVSPAGLITGTPAKAGTSTVTATVTDRVKDADSTQFSWTVYALPEIAGPGDQKTFRGEKATLKPTATGGRAPLTWSATGLPGGLSIDAATGTISGTATTRQTTTVTVKVTDRGGKTDTVTFSWEVVDPPRFAAAGTRTNYIRDWVAGFKLTAIGGTGPYTWSAENLPEGLRIDPSTGEIYGTVWQGARYLTTVHVRDRRGEKASTTFLWRVLPRQPNDLTIVLPDPDDPDQVSTADRWLRLSLEAAGGSNSGYDVWSAEGLPPGLSIDSTGRHTGKITGTPTTPGTYTVTLTVTDSPQKAATLMFTWTVQ